jgi:hypothetical protein
MFEIVKRSETNPAYVLAREDGHLGIYIEAAPGESGSGSVAVHELVQDDAVDLEGDFETHVDAIEEEIRVLMAEAVAEFS